jgi:hypothetical protein
VRNKFAASHSYFLRAGPYILAQIDRAKNTRLANCRDLLPVTGWIYVLKEVTD